MDTSTNDPLASRLKTPRRFQVARPLHYTTSSLPSERVVTRCRKCQRINKTAFRFASCMTQGVSVSPSYGWLAAGLSMFFYVLTRRSGGRTKKYRKIYPSQERPLLSSSINSTRHSTLKTDTTVPHASLRCENLVPSHSRFQSVSR